ncbi:helix-turn-helix transcriptional regulator [Tsukamurella sp. NPDC003166]|uniref:helix-turn-helix domain-containing protein n=1 Tax=Tsukamurella sp. NPDC003166 TaxID=3154444 RepID=UPI0033AD3AB4
MPASPIEMHLAKQLGLRLRRLREDRGYTQESMAAKTGIDPKTYQGYENGVGDYKSGRPFNPKLNTLMAIASGLELTTPALMMVLFDADGAQETTAPRVAGGSDLST